MDLSLIRLFLLASILNTEARHLYMLEGHHVQLDIQGHEELRREDIDYVHWYFHKSVVKHYPVTKTPFLKYYPISEKLIVLPDLRLHDSVEFDSRNFSMKLKNLHKNDSGLYRGEIGAGKKSVYIEYNLSVLDQVSTPNLTVVSSWSSADSCNVTLSCRGHDLSLTFICNGSSCTHKGPVFSNTSLIVVSREDRIICNYSNQVSWRSTVLGMEQVCPDYFDQTTNLSEVSAWTWIGISFSLSLLATVAGCTLLRLRKSKNKGGNTHSDSEVAHPSDWPASQPLASSSVSLPSQQVSSSGVHGHSPQHETLYSTLQL